MPPRVGSRHTFTQAVLRGEIEELTEREPFLFRELDDNEEITVGQGDSWFTIASRVYKELPRAAGFWWVIADFQPSPVVDSTILPEPGTKIFAPSLNTLITRILSERRRREH